MVEFVQSLDLRDDKQNKISPYVHQWLSVAEILSKKRTTILSPTASGKSLVIYILIRWMQYKGLEKKILVLVPTTALVEQMYSDFDDYAYSQKWTSEKNVHKIYDYKGMTKTSPLPVYVSTWQSVYKMSRKYFDQFNMICVDEAHQCKASSLTSIMEKSIDCEYKAGLTGTLDGAEANEWVIEGLLGPRKIVATTEELMQKGIVSNLKIKAIQLQHQNKDGKFIRKHCKDYPDEVKFIEDHIPRNNFICNLAATQEQNTLVLFSKIEHGRRLHEYIKERYPDKKVYMIHGSVGLKESGIPMDTKGKKVSKKEMTILLKNEIRALSERETGIVVLATYGVFSTGINIKNLHNIIFASSTRSKIRVLQSIGRSLRLHAEKNHAVLYDVVDDFSIKSYQNHMVNHFVKRFAYYTKEKFDYEIIKVKL